MNHSEFLKISDELKSDYPQAFNEKTFQRMWEFCKLIPLEDLGAAVNHLADNGQKMSLVALRSQCSSAINRARLAQKSAELEDLQKSGFNCPSCYNTGTILAKSRKHPNAQSYAFRCLCQYGAVSGYKYQSWGPDLEREFQIDYVPPSGWKEIKRKNPNLKFTDYLMSIIDGKGSAVVNMKKQVINLEELPF